MEIRTVLIFLFFTSAFLYLLGYQPAFLYLWSKHNYSMSSFFNALFQSITSIVTDPAFLGIFATAAVVTLVSGGGGQSLIGYVFPIFILGVLLNAFFLPTSYLFDTNMPSFIRMFIHALVNIMLAIGVINFVRGAPA